MAFDIGDFIQQVGDTVANQKGYDNLQDLAIGAAAKNVTRITDKPNEVKQTPPLQTPGAYSLELLSAQKGPLGLTTGQMLIIGAIGAGIIFLAVRR